MLLDDALANGKAETGAFAFSVSRERFKEAPQNFGRDSPAGILNFGDDRVGFRGKSEFDRSTPWHFVHRISDQIMEHAPEPLWIHRHFNTGRLAFQLQCYPIVGQLFMQISQSGMDE